LAKETTLLLPASAAGLPSVVCIIFATKKSRDTFPTFIHWGQCDQLAVVDLVPTRTISEWEATLQLIRKFRSNDASNRSWFVLATDTTFMRMSVLKAYLASLNVYSFTKPKPVYLGRRILHPSGMVMNAWNSGVVLNTEAIDALLNAVDSPLPHTQMFRPLVLNSTIVEVDASFTTKWIYQETIPLGIELICSAGSDQPTPIAARLAACLASEDVLPEDTRDPHGRERFHLTGLENLENVQSWKTLKEGSVLKERFAPFPFSGALREVSEKSISFSPVSNAMVNALNSFLTDDCLLDLNVTSRLDDAYARDKTPMQNSQVFKRKFP
jgi:hypothetical protein